MSFAEFIYRAIGFGIHDLFDNGLVRLITKNHEVGSWQSALAIGIGMLLCIAASYLLGSINTALIISKTLYKDDVREHGSGNAGTTNVLRTYGKKPAILTFVGDALKVVVAIVFAGVVFGCPAGEMNYLYLVTAVYLSAFLCVFGHVFPVFSHFRGGKGFATMVGAILVLNPFIFVVLFIIYVPMVLCSHYISLSSVVMALFYPMFLSATDRVFTQYGVNVLFSVMIGVLITWAHRSNLRRIYEGNERKFYLGKKHKAEQQNGSNEK
ncbi:MAG: glycerol-3-phosphate 1-O-acyltransferase PlsY [Clostridia bacterium]|nr:glycerol-3-phosphate 1-O-acyltransferase PlsY [Clostridia bacterium]